MNGKIISLVTRLGKAYKFASFNSFVEVEEFSLKDLLTFIKYIVVDHILYCVLYSTVYIV